MQVWVRSIIFTPSDHFQGRTKIHPTPTVHVTSNVKKCKTSVVFHFPRTTILSVYSTIMVVRALCLVGNVGQHTCRATFPAEMWTGLSLSLTTSLFFHSFFRPWYIFIVAPSYFIFNYWMLSQHTIPILLLNKQLYYLTG